MVESFEISSKKPESMVVWGGHVYYVADTRLIKYSVDHDKEVKFLSCVFFSSSRFFLTQFQPLLTVVKILAPEGIVPLINLSTDTFREQTNWISFQRSFIIDYSSLEQNRFHNTVLTPNKGLLELSTNGSNEHLFVESRVEMLVVGFYFSFADHFNFVSYSKVPSSEFLL